MTTNLYAPPVPSSDKSSVKRPFFKSGARLLVAALIGRFVFTFGPYLLLFIADPMMMVSFMGAFQISSVQGVLVFPSVTKGIAAIFTSFIPIGAWLFGRTQQLTGRLLWLWRGVTAIAVFLALLNWGQNIYLLLLLSGTATEPMPLLVTLASGTKTLMGLGLALLVRQIANRGSSIPARGLATAYILVIVFEYAWSFFV